MTEAIVSSSPTKTLSTWWRSFKQKEGEDEHVQALQRPGLNRASVSSSAVPRDSAAGGAAGEATHGIAIPPQYSESPIFGVPLAISLRYASVKISLTDRDGESFVYGHIPIIVAKCAVFLKQSARETEGIFRVPGSVRRIKVLQELFNTPPSFGKDLEWQGFTVHDAAGLLKRYLTQLPESIIPRRFYDAFREPLQTRFVGIRDWMNYHAITGPSSPHSQTAGAASMVSPPPEPTAEDIADARRVYEDLIFKLPPSALHLLVYLLDLLSMFSAQSDINRMPVYNLAAIFQPSILALPEHQMKPEEYQTSRLVIEFLINHSLSILRRVEARAIEDHVTQKEELMEASQPRSPAASENEEGPLPSFVIPQFNVKGADDPPQGSAQGPAQVPTPRSSTDETHDQLIMQQTQQTQPTHRRRQHSKSLSSAHPPGGTPQEQTKLPGFLRRQRSRSDKEDEGRVDELPPSRQNTRSPSGEEEERKSRFRRSLMVLLPNRDEHPGQRNTSPLTSSKPELSRSPSWFARLSSNSASRSGTPEA